MARLPVHAEIVFVELRKKCDVASRRGRFESGSRLRINHAWVAQFGQSIALVTRRSAVRGRLQAPVRGRVIGSSPVLETGSCRFEPCPRSSLPGVAQRQSRPLLTVTMGVQIRPARTITARASLHNSSSYLISQFDENCGVSVEVRNGEERLARRGEDRILLREIRDANGEDSPLGRRRRVELPDVRSAEATIPGNALPETNHVRLPWRSPAVTAHNSHTTRRGAIRSGARTMGWLRLHN